MLLSTLKSRIVAWSFALLLPMLLTTGVSLILIQERLSARIDADLANAARLEAARINDVLTSHERSARLLAANVALREFGEFANKVVLGEIPASAMYGGFDGLAPINMNMPSPFDELVVRLRENSAAVGSDVVEISFVNTVGQVLGQTPDFSWEPYDETLITSSMALEETLVGNAFRTASGQELLGVVSPVYGVEGAIVGAVVLEMRLGPIVNLVVEHEGFGQTSEAHIAQPDRNGNAEFITLMRFARDAAFNKTVPKSKNLPINWSLESPTLRVVRSPDYRSIMSILAIQTISRTGWGLVVKIDEEEALVLLSEVRRFVYGAIVAILSLYAIFFMLFLMPLGRRLSKTSVATRAIAAGDYHCQLDPSGHDELSDVARSLHQLSSALTSEQTRRREVEDQLRHQATHDTLTGLHNRKSMIEHLTALEQEQGDLSCVLYFLDLDQFKPVNDGFGHTAGDAVLIEVGRRLSELVADHGKVSRWGGDEFVVAINDCDPVGVPLWKAQLQAVFDAPIEFEQYAHKIGCSIGVANGLEFTSVELMLENADRRMYQEKARQTEHLRAA